MRNLRVGDLRLTAFGMTGFPSKPVESLVYSVGGNEEAARLSGIPVWRTCVTVFAISGLMAAISGILLSSRVMAGASNLAEGLEFEVIAAVIIGGTSLAGGEGSVLGTFIVCRIDQRLAEGKQ